METNLHSITHLFAQLGLPSGDADIQTFIASHRPLDTRTPLCDAPFWTASQAKFLHDQIATDADWADVVDKLDVSLRQSLGY